jgi:hypothetical protein
VVTAAQRKENPPPQPSIYESEQAVRDDPRYVEVNQKRNTNGVTLAVVILVAAVIAFAGYFLFSGDPSQPVSAPTTTNENTVVPESSGAGSAGTTTGTNVPAPDATPPSAQESSQPPPAGSVTQTPVEAEPVPAIPDPTTPPASGATPSAPSGANPQ